MVPPPTSCLSIRAGVRPVLGASSAGGGGSGGGGAASGLCGGMAPGGRVMAASMGFSMSMAPPHFAHLVRARGRLPSLLSSNL